MISPKDFSKTGKLTDTVQFATQLTNDAIPTAKPLILSGKTSLTS